MNARVKYVCTYLMARAADDGRKDGARGVVASEAGFAHAGTIVHNESGNFVVTHFA